jgi:FixJ family two-component response regulator
MLSMAACDLTVTKRSATKTNPSINPIHLSEFSRPDQVIAGLLNKQIAAELGAALRTIKTHRGRVMHKMRVASVAELTRLAQQAGVTPAPLGP